MAKLNSTIVQGSLRVTDEINASAIKVNGTNVLTSHQSVSSSNNTASFGSAVVVGNVGGTDLKFTMPANPNSNTWRKVQLNGTDKLGTGTGTNPLNIKAGSNMTITESSGTFTFAATDTTYSNASQSAAGLMSATDKTRVDNMWSALNGTDSTKIDTIAEVYAFLEDYAQTTDLAAQLGTKITANTAITGATKCKITYDSKGLVTGGADLAASDIPDLSSTYLKRSGGTMTGLLTAKTDASSTGIKLGNAYLTAISSNSKNDVIFQNATIRFGTSDWDYNKWAGLKFDATNKIIHLGLADGTIFTANSAQSGGKLYLPGISSVYVGNGTTALVLTNDSRLSNARPASDVYTWAKASTKPSYNLDEVSDGTTRKLSNYVPFSGATSDVDLGAAVKLSAGFLDIYATSTSTSTNPYSNYIAFRESTAANNLTGIRLYADGTDLIVKNVDSSGNLVTRETIATQEYISALGYTSNVGTVTGIKVGSSGSTLSPSSGVVTIPAYPTKSSWNYDDQYVKLSGNQTIAGIKEFSDCISMANHPINWSVYGPLTASISAQLYGANDNEIRLDIDSENHIFLNAQNGQIRFTATSVNIGGKEIATQEWVTGKGYTSNTGTVTSVRVQAGTGLSSSVSTAQTGSLNTTISIASGYKLPTTTEWSGKQDALTAQTAYSAKGSATKVPQITTNSLGQVTGITEVTITNTKTYKHDIAITDSSNSYIINFTAYSNTSTAFTVTGAIQLLFNKPPAVASGNRLSAWAKSSVPFSIVKVEWTQSYFYPRAILAAVTYSGNNLTSFTIRPMEGAMDFDGYNMRISLFTSDIAFTVSNLSISDTVTEC